VPDRETAERLARTLVGERLAACVNVMPAMQSIFRWKGQIETATEQMLVIKTRTADYAVIERRIRSLHPYELPEVIAVPVVAGLSEYLAWLDNPDPTP
jgi:periplasmic divalent cation tolerance protein